MTTYLLLAYLVGRSWPVLLIGASIFLGTWLGLVDSRFLLWPLVLLLLAAVLKRFTRVRAAALGFLTVFQAILTPEMAAAVPIVAVVVAAYEWYWRGPGAPLARGFSADDLVCRSPPSPSQLRSAIYMASRGALGDLMSVTLVLLAGHFGLGIPPTVGGAPQASMTSLRSRRSRRCLISFAYAVARLRLRRPFWLADWPMAAVALYVLVLLHEVPDAHGLSARLSAVHDRHAADDLHRLPRGRRRRRWIRAQRARAGTRAG